MDSSLIPPEFLPIVNLHSQVTKMTLSGAEKIYKKSFNWSLTHNKNNWLRHTVKCYGKIIQASESSMLYIFLV